MVLSFSWSFRFSWADTVDSPSVPDLDQIAEPSFDPNTEYFCLEHLQPLIPPEDLEQGQVQVCLGCHPEFLDMQPAIYADNATPLFPSGVAWSKWVDNLVWTNCPTVIGEDQTVLYKLNSRGGGRSGNVLIRLIFSSQVQKRLILILVLLVLLLLLTFCPGIKFLVLFRFLFLVWVLLGLVII